jgi:hypothetical protein
MTTERIISQCPHCQKRNVSPGHVMGHLGKGKKKMFKPDHLLWLARHMKRVNQRRLDGLKLTTKIP